MKVKLGDICKIYSGGDKPKVVSPHKTEECKIPIYGNAIEEEGLYGYTNFSVIDEKAVTISARGSNCGASFFRNEPYVPIVRLLSLIPCDEIIVPEYLYYIIKNRPFKSAGSGQPQITIPQISDCEIEIEENIDRQKRIAKVLFDIDLKIKNNNAINVELEAMARTIYDYWFLQFDFPDENGKPYKSSGGKMVWNEELKREIPEGWSVGSLYDIADFVNGLACQKYRPLSDDKKIPVVKIAEMHSGITATTEYVRDDIPEKNRINDGDILFSWSATLETMIWTGGKAGLNQHIFKVIPKRNERYYVYMQLSKYLMNFIKMAEARKTTMGHITTEHIKQSKIVVPCGDIALKYHKLVDDMFLKVISNSKESRELVSMYSFLLPLLLNGQVGFKEQ